MTIQENIQEQVDYYRARASEYDEWFYRIGRYDRGSEINQRWFNEVGVVKSALHNILRNTYFCRGGFAIIFGKNYKSHKPARPDIISIT
jgi:hypothetical protein